MYKEFHLLGILYFFQNRFKLYKIAFNSLKESNFFIENHQIN